jgi:hypothetical protein
MAPAINFTEFTNLAVLHYKGANDSNPVVDPTVNIPNCTLPLVETNLHVGFIVFLSPNSN